MRKLVLAAAAAAVFMASACRVGQEPIVIKFSHVVANDTPKGKGALKFKELAEKYTNGKVKVEVYPNSTLYKDKEEIEALQLGSVQMLAPSTAKFAPLGAKEFEALDLPWLFKDDATYAKAMKGRVGKWLFKKLESKGITGLAYWDNGFHMVSANRPLLMPADFQGLKIRISGSKIADQYFRELGSIPQIMAFSEVYQALQTGVVDGCENTPSNYLTQKFHEVQKHITVSYHAHLQYAVIVNSKFWNGLPADIRGQLDKAMDEATDYTNSIAAQGKRRCARGDQEVGQDHAALSDRRSAQGLADGDGADLQVGQGPRRQRGARPAGEGTRYQDELTPVAACTIRKRPGVIAAPGRFAGEGDLACSSVLNRALDHLEEWLIATLIAAATALIFVAVLHRYGTGLSIDLAKWAAAHGVTVAAGVLAASIRWLAALRPVLGAGTVHLHVHLDGQVRRRLWRAHRHPCRRRRAGQPAAAGIAQAGDPVRAAVRRVLHRRRSRRSAARSSARCSRPASSRTISKRRCGSSISRSRSAPA